jgi:hypothetical protein
MNQSSTLSVALVVVSAGSDAGRQLPLRDGRNLVGRGPRNNVELTDPSVSRCHAAVDVGPDGLWLEDLGSSIGTRVNHQQVTTPVRVGPDDWIELGLVQLRVGSRPSPETVTPPSAVHYDIGSQSHGTFNNVGGDQYVNHVHQQREPFLREIAGTRTKARWLVWLGVLISVAGYAWALLIMSSLFGTFGDIARAGPGGEELFSSFVDQMGTYVGAVAVVAVGNIVLLIGAVLHIIATARRRRVDRDFPLPWRRT